MRLLVVCFVLVFSGCASRVEYVQFEQPSDKPIKAIGIPPLEAPPFEIDNIDDPRLMFGLIGGLASVAHTGAQTKALKEDSPEFNYGETLHVELAERLRDMGYSVVDLSVKREAPEKFLVDYSRFSSTEVDAVLDVATLQAGYCNQSWDENGDLEYGYRPCFRVITQLVSPMTRDVLYSQTFMYGSHNHFMKEATNLTAPPETFFDDYEAMKENKAKVISALERATKEISIEIVKQLPKV